MEKLELHKKLIAESLENWHGLKKASIDNFAQTGKASGSFFLGLMEYAESYHNEMQVTSHPTIPSDEGIEIHYPCELGQKVRMEENYSYGEIIKANYHRRQGAKWMRSLCQAKLAESEREMKEFRQLARLISALNEDHENFKCIAGHIQLARKLLTTTNP